ncbi:hypothetical protein CF70_008365 [Cupriavidus sp. SK-3]|nr:hypothetical protein CF70_008365 [Cupriavidus sp. SK-3]
MPVALSTRIPQAMSVLYDRKQITDWLGSHTVAKAREYVHAVSELRWLGADTLGGWVQGTRTRPYDVRAYFHDVDDDMWVEGECTCPVSVDCKHVAALLIPGLGHMPTQPVSSVRSELVTWLEGFRTKYAPSPGSKKTTTANTALALVYVITSGSYRSSHLNRFSMPVAAPCASGRVRVMVSAAKEGAPLLKG